MAETTIAFDLGGTKIDICRMRPDGSFVFRDRVATASLGPGRPEFLDAAFDLFQRYVEAADSKIGLSWNAPVHESRLTQSSLLGGRIEVDLGDMLQRRFDRSYQVESDVQAMALGEYRFGQGHNAAPLVVVNLGSGSGFAYHDGSVMRGYRGGAGLISQERFFVEEISDWLIMDHLLSGRGVALIYERLSGQPRTAVDISGLVGSDAAASETFAIIGKYLGRLLVMLARHFNPRTFVLCGSVAQAATHFIDLTRAYVREHAEPACQPDAIVVSQLEAAACRGLV
jgi:predicted NBD/HSP70 family sugar kinase